MSELRLNLIAKEWVIIATEHAKKPEEFRQWKEKRYLPEYLDSCPFCPGNEATTPNEIFRVEEAGTWKIRVIPNRLAVVSDKVEGGRVNVGLRHSAIGVGRHEIIVESPIHNMSIPFLEIGDISGILKVYRDRFIEAYKDPKVEHVIIFKNQGEASGTTLQHPHSQLIGIPVVPQDIRARIEETMRYYNTTGDCLMCATINDELTDGKRIISATEHFVTFIPYAALSPFHTWIFPKRHMASFADIEDSEINDLAMALRTALSKLHYGLDNPDFNYVIRSEGPQKNHSKHFHWYLSIVPRLSQASGFALGSGMYINPSLPEKVASFMREVRLP